MASGVAGIQHGCRIPVPGQGLGEEHHRFFTKMAYRGSRVGLEMECKKIQK
jgi:hypothetical protein